MGERFNADSKRFGFLHASGFRSGSPRAERADLIGGRLIYHDISIITADEAYFRAFCIVRSVFQYVLESSGTVT